MHILATITRRLILSIIAILSSLLLAMLILVWSLNQTVLSRDSIHDWVAQPETYDLVKQSVGQSLKEQEDFPPQSADRSQVEELTELVEKYFSPDKFASLTDEIIDGVFNWLEGEDNVKFEVQLFDNRQQLTNFFVDAQQLRLRSLEPCTTQQLATKDQSDLFSIDCRPPNVSEQKLRSLLDSAESDQIDELLAASTISSEDLEFNEIESDAEQIKAVYYWATVLPLVLVIVVVLVLSLALLVYRDWRKWLHYSGWLLVVLPGLVLVAAATMWHSDSLRELAFNSLQFEDIDPQLLQAAIEPIAIDFGRVLVTSSFYIVAMGVLALTVVNWQKLCSITKFKRH